MDTIKIYENNCDTFEKKIKLLLEKKETEVSIELKELPELSLWGKEPELNYDEDGQPYVKDGKIIRRYSNYAELIMEQLKSRGLNLICVNYPQEPYKIFLRLEKGE